MVKPRTMLRDFQLDKGSKVEVKKRKLKPPKVRTIGTSEMVRKLYPEVEDAHPMVQAIFISYFRRSAMQHLEFNLDLESFKKLIRKPCAYCGAEPKISKWQNVKKMTAWNGLDRVNNSGGYTIDNVVACCKTCNSWKKNRRAADFISHALRVARWQGQKRESQIEVQHIENTGLSTQFDSSGLSTECMTDL